MKMEEQETIVTQSKIAYTVLQKVFCCRCFHCLQRVNYLTSDLRKQTLQKMIKNYVISEDEQNLYDPIKLMILIHLCEDSSIPQRHIQKCRLNPNVGIETYRTDLQFYIPQVSSCVVFLNDLKDSNYLLHAMQKACRLNFYFGHLYYFYIASLEKIVDKYQIQVLKKVTAYKQKFLESICHTFEGQGLTSIEFYSNQKPQAYPTDPDIGYLIKTYGTKNEDRSPNPRLVTAGDVTLPNYSSVFKTEVELFSFKSNINFFEDLFLISDQLKSQTDKKAKLQEMLAIVNEKLPACVYIPFSKNSTRLCNVLNIVIKECRVFSTKERAPFYICVQTYCPCQHLSQQKQDRFWQKVETPITLKTSFKSDNHLRRVTDNRTSLNTTYYRNKAVRHLSDPYSNSIQTEILSERGESRYITNKLLEFTNEMPTIPRLQKSSTTSKNTQMKTIIDSSLKSQIKSIFGLSLEEQQEKVRVNSIYSGLNSWELVHLMVKTNDNLKQEQFATQLIYQFDYIFKLEKLPLLLTPYEALSMGPDTGILQMVKEAVTLDHLKKKLKSIEGLKNATLKQFFQLYYGDSIGEAKDKFLRSLAAYSLVMYFLQVKDRHNGNIMLHRTGKIFHIDFGFLLSNLPGKGVQLEKDVPFKLLMEYIDILDGPESYYFKKFREYLFLGFKAVRKHQNKILILVKMMYSSTGMAMPCFQKGQETIRSLQERFNPPDIMSDAQLNLHCQKLIDSSLDNWAAKWYDRWQYWAQGIVY